MVPLLLALLACAPDADGDGVPDRDDCAPADPDRSPEADEVCNRRDDDCDGLTDEVGAVDAPTWYSDRDEDGWGQSILSTEDCQQPAGFVSEPGDCDDDDPEVHPGAEERCNEVDDDCDGRTDEGDAVDASTWYRDGDGDGHGDPDRERAACTRPDGFVEEADDCDDTDARVHPGGRESCDRRDEDCDGAVDEDAWDAPAWHPDRDGDGWGDAETALTGCRGPAGWLTDGSDCDDGDPAVHPGAEEVFYDGVDGDCDGGSDYDQDGDGWDADEWGGADCDDRDPATSPDAVEVDDLADNDCDGACDEGFVAAGDLVLVELMVDPAAVYDSLGEWVEIANASSRDIRVCGGWSLSDDGRDAHVVDTDLLLAPGDLAVLGLEDDPSLNGGVTLDYEYADFHLLNGGDTAILSHEGAVVDEVVYDFDDPGWAPMQVSGASLQLSDDALDATSNDDPGSWCLSASVEGTDAGSPGEANATCE